MQKLQELHLEPIKKYKEVLAASKSAEITKDVAIKFSEWVAIKKYEYYLDVEKENYWKSYKGKYFTTKELFEEFLKQYNGTIN